MRAVDERREVGIRPEMRIDAREVEPPVPVVRGAVTLHRLLDDDRREPDGREPEVFHASEPGARVRACSGEALQVASVVPTRVGRVVARDGALAREAASVVRGVAVRVAIGHHEVDALGRERAVRRRLGERLELGADGRLRGHVGRGASDTREQEEAGSRADGQAST